MRSPEGTRLASGLMGRAVVQEWMRNRRASRPEDVPELESLLGALPRDDQKESVQEGIICGPIPLHLSPLRDKDVSPIVYFTRREGWIRDASWSF